MLHNKKYLKYFFLISFLLIVAFILNIGLGSVAIPIKEIIKILTTNISTKQSWETIILNYRLPKAFTAILVGSGLSISGLLMQTLFRNPLAGPFVLGISSGASLGVSILILGGTILSSNLILTSNWILVIAASTGSFILLTLVIIASNRVRNTMSILIIGLMFGSLSSAIISILTYFSSAKQIQQYMFWSFGSIGNLSWNELSVFFLVYILGLIIIFFIIKPLNSFLLGENYARSTGINLKKTRTFILLSTSILTGVITAFTGPIAFIGLAVPHITKIFFPTSNHKILIPAVSIFGAIILLISDSIAQLPGSEYTLPINAITSIFGAPIVILMMVRKNKIYI